MVTKTERERLAVLEEQGKQNMAEHKELKTLIKEGNKELKDFIKVAATKADLDTKADLEDFQAVKSKQNTLNSRLWGLFIFLLTLLTGALGWAIQYIITHGGLN